MGAAVCQPSRLLGRAAQRAEGERGQQGGDHREGPYGGQPEPLPHSAGHQVQRLRRGLPAVAGLGHVEQRRDDLRTVPAAVRAGKRPEQPAVATLEAYR
nr:hypothetical protein GCM10020092_056270 [Actinoplanes digitatis]